MTIREHLKRIIGTEHEWDSHYENIIRLINGNLLDKRLSNLLDVGCGDGLRGRKFAQYLNIGAKCVYGIEREFDYLSKNADQFNNVVVDLEQNSIPFKSTTFSLVICNQVLEHLKNYREVIHEIIRVTKRNGYIVLGVPNLAHLINRWLLLCGKQPMCIGLNSNHVRGFAHSAFLSMLRELKEVKVIDSAGSNLMYPLPVSMAAKLSNRCIGLTAFTCYLLRKVR